MSSIQTSTCSPLQPQTPASPSPAKPIPPPPNQVSQTPAPYSMAALFRRLENGRYALTGSTGDAWDVAHAPNWRSESKLLDPLLTQANDVVGSLAFATNVAANAGGRVFHDIPQWLPEAPEAIDRGLKKTIGVNLEELGVLTNSALPQTILIDDLAVASWRQLKGLSQVTKRKILGPNLLIPAKARDHIYRRHAWVDLSLDRSVFFPHIDRDLLVKKARRIPPVFQSNGNYVRIAKAKEYVGLDKMTGRPTKVYTVVTDPTDIKVVTEHPGLPDPKYRPD